MEDLKKWDREEVVILVYEYFRTKNLTNEEIEKNYELISVFLRKREAINTGKMPAERFRNYAGIRMQSGRIRCLDPNTRNNGMKATKLQKEIVEEYLQCPEKINAEAENIYRKYFSKHEKNNKTKYGYELNEGKYNQNFISNDEIWDTFNWLFSPYSHNDTSYKFIFLKSIIECLDYKDANGRIKFDILFFEFTRISWNLVLKYNISQKAKVRDGRTSSLENVLRNEYTSKDLFDELPENRKLDICYKVKKECKKYVVGALYSDTKEYMYSFSKKEEWIQVNPLIEDFIKKNVSIIENLNYYKWSCFYDLVNDKKSKEELIKNFRIDCQRKNESIYRAILAYEFETLDDNVKTINPIELLLDANQLDYEEDIIDETDMEQEMYKDVSHLTKYLNDPILLIEQLKKEKGISTF